MFRLQKLIDTKKLLNYEIGSEVEDAGAFDDITIKLDFLDKNVCRILIQLKHKTGKKVSINEKDLQGSNDFSISKYFQTFLEMKNSDIYDEGFIKYLILSTNIGLKEDTLKSLEEVYAINEIFKFSESGNFYKFKSVESILPFIDEDKIKANYNDIDINEFIELFVLAVNQPNNDELKSLILREFPEIRQEKFFSSIKAELNDWMLAGIGEYLDPQKFKDIHGKTTKTCKKLYALPLTGRVLDEEEPATLSLVQLKIFIADPESRSQILYYPTSSKEAFLNELNSSLIALEKEVHYLPDQKYLHESHEILWIARNQVLIIDCGTTLRYKDKLILEKSCEKVIVLLPGGIELKKRTVFHNFPHIPRYIKSTESVKLCCNEDEFKESSAELSLLLKFETLELLNIQFTRNSSLQGLNNPPSYEVRIE